MAADLGPAAALLLRSGPPKDYPISGAEISLGFAGRNDVRVALEGVSRRHAKITFDGQDYWIEDAGSSNGTFLNGIPVVQKERLRHLDVVTLGRRAELVFVRKAVGLRRTRKKGILKAWLETVDGPEAGEKREIPRGAITLGRSPSANVVVNSQLISKAHARIERSGMELILTDLQSANGTYVEDKRIDSRVLKTGDEFSLGKARTYRVRIEEGEIETTELGPSAAVDSTSGGLPTEWKTRLEWTPDEKAAFDRFRDEAAAKAEAAKPAPKAPLKPRPAPKAEPKPKEEARPPEKPAASPERLKPEPPPVQRIPVEAKAEPAKAEPAAKSEPPPIPPAAPPSVEKPEPKTISPASPPSVEKPEPKPIFPAARPPVEKPEPKPISSAAPPPIEKPEPEPRDPLATRPKPPPPVASPAPAERPVPLPKKEPAAAPAAGAEESMSSAKTRAIPRPPPAPPSPEPKAVPQRRVSLEGKVQGFAVGLGDHEIGRVPLCAIRLDNPQISRRHAILHVTAGEVTIEDLGSANGVFVNGKKISGRQRLVEGDLLGFGDLVFRVRIGSTESSPPAGSQA